ncbi:MAG: class I SAM-dependent methyltransferase [Clostridiales bacterium]|nr:class I SAM-dependent methyltransferase [Clostridiales bacterium]
MKLADNWVDYKVIATGNGNKLEQWGAVCLLRPDPQVIWHENFCLEKFSKLNAVYLRSSSGGGNWEVKKPFADEWVISYPLFDRVLKLSVKAMGFKHTGVFPEQSVNWQTLYKIIKSKSTGLIENSQIKVLNLFGYTGAASVVCSLAGAKVTHVDAAKNMVQVCKQNSQLNCTSNIRYIVEDCNVFVQRELKRGNMYQGIIMDPPSFGRGPNNQPWKLTDHICDLVKNSSKLLSKQPLFFLINSYTTGLQPSVLQNILKMFLPSGNIQVYELALPTEEKDIILPCGCSGLWNL